MIEYEKFTELEELIESAPSKPRSIIDETPYDKISHWPSQLTSCQRQLYYGFIDPIDWNPNVQTEITFAFGHAFEKVLKERLQRCNIYRGDEEPFTLKDERLKYPFRGKVDLVIEIDGVLRPVELKTMNSNQYNDNEYGPVVFPGGRTKPKNYHVSQLNLYMKKMEVDWGIIAYTCKDTTEWNLFKVYYSEEHYDQVVEHLMRVENAVKAKETPPAIMLDDDNQPFEIKDIALTTYKVSRKGQFEKGDVKPDKYNKDEGKIGFPCIWKDKNTGAWNTCDYFERCWTSKLDELGLTMDDLK